MLVPWRVSLSKRNQALEKIDVSKMTFHQNFPFPEMAVSWVIRWSFRGFRTSVHLCPHLTGWVLKDFPLRGRETYAHETGLVSYSN